MTQNTCDIIMCCKNLMWPTVQYCRELILEYKIQTHGLDRARIADEKLMVDHCVYFALTDYIKGCEDSADVVEKLFKDAELDIWDIYNNIIIRVFQGCVVSRAGQYINGFSDELLASSAKTLDHGELQAAAMAAAMERRKMIERQ